MKIKLNPTLLLLVIATACISLVGCGPSYDVVPVSGVISVNGEPVSGINIVYYPQGTEANPNPGPFSKGKSGPDGKYSLTTRDGFEGAIVGKHRVMIEMGDGDSEMTQEDLDEVKSELDELSADGDKAAAAKAKKRYDKLKKKFDKKTVVPKEYLDGKYISVTIGSGGTTKADIDL